MKVILICGKICCGKTTYTQKLLQTQRAVLLSCDEITLGLFDGNLGDQHDAVVEKVKRYLYRKSLEILRTDTDVILDWGFWQKESRKAARSFYQSHDIPCELHYIEVTDAVWQERIACRNRTVTGENPSAYFVDEGLAAKCSAAFEAPSPEEVNVYVR